MAVTWVVFHLTDRCQLDCVHCLRDPGKRPLDLDPALIRRVVSQARARYGCRHFGFTGGEPLLHPALGEVLDAVVAEGATFHVVTGGGDFARFLALLDADPRRREAITAVNFSLDGPREELHDAIRGPGSYRAVMAAATLAKAQGLPFTLQMTVHARNVDAIEEFGLAAAALGAARVMYGPTQPTGTPRDAVLWMPPAGWRSARDRLDRLAEALRIPVTIAEGFPEEDRFQVCPAWRSEILHVDLHGRLSLCCQLSGTPGGDADAVADLAQVDLVEAHRRLLRLIHDLEDRRLVAIGAGPGDAWDAFGCNLCQASFGKPYWTSEGSAGPKALRPRFGPELTRPLVPRGGGGGAKR
jgi:MoaA/NifB/PqqE/SkfB family radical SAM enzyme